MTKYILKLRKVISFISTRLLERNGLVKVQNNQNGYLKIKLWNELNVEEFNNPQKIES